MSGDAEMLKGMLNDCRRECERLTRERDESAQRAERFLRERQDADFRRGLVESELEARNASFDGLTKALDAAQARAEEAERSRDDALARLELCDSARHQDRDAYDEARASLAAARDVLRDCAIFMESAERHVQPRGTPWHAGLLAMIDKAKAAARGGGRVG